MSLPSSPTPPKASAIVPACVPRPVITMSTIARITSGMPRMIDEEQPHRRASGGVRRDVPRRERSDADREDEREQRGGEGDSDGLRHRAEHLGGVVAAEVRRPEERRSLGDLRPDRDQVAPLDVADEHAAHHDGEREPSPHRVAHAHRVPRPVQRGFERRRSRTRRSSSRRAPAGRVAGRRRRIETHRGLDTLAGARYSTDGDSTARSPGAHSTGEAHHPVPEPATRPARPRASPSAPRSRRSP